MKSDIGMINAFVPGAVELTQAETEMIERRRRLLGPAYRLFYDRPLEIVRGEGIWLYDRDDTPYMDVYNNVASVGHCHPHVVSAMARQAGLLSTNTRYLHDTVLSYAERLLATFPQELSQIMFTCTGSEANDLALRIARARTGGTGIIITETAYHGVTQSVAEISPSLGRNVDLGVHVRTVPAPDSYRSPTGDVAVEFRAAVEAAIADLERHGIRAAALICDTIFSSDGVMSEQPGFLRGAVEVIRAAGGLFIADEVQPGFGRTGDAMWGFQRHGVTPDMVSLGKPMGNGYPVAGVVMRPEVVAEFGAKSRYFNTFGGNTVAAATAMAVLEVIENESLQANAKAVGGYFRSQMEHLAGRHERIGDIRGTGLFLGIEIVSDRATKAGDADATLRIVNGLRDARILISATGPRASVLKVRPPLVFTRANVDQFTETFDAVLSQLA